MAGNQNTPTTLDPIQIVQPQSQLVTIKLNESNYLVWRQQILAAVRGHGLEGFLTGAQRSPEQFLTGNIEDCVTVNPSYISWIRQDQLLVSWLLSSLSENILVTTVGLNTAKEIWESLEIGFASQSRAKVMQYRLQLQTLKKGSMNMRDYLNKIKACCDVLAATGQKLTDEDQILHILSGLGNEYDPVMVSITSRIEPCSLREVHALLLSFESRLEGSENPQFNTEGSSPSINMTAQVSGFGRGSNFQGGRGRSNTQFRNNRGGRGYGRNNSFRGRGGRFNNNNKPRCQLCYYTGHTADKCFHRFDMNFVPPSNNNGIFNQGSTSGNFQNSSLNANVASMGSNESSHEVCWYPDSGATNHVTYDLSNLNVSSEYQGADKVQVGNGTGSIHRGGAPQREC